MNSEASSGICGVGPVLAELRRRAGLTLSTLADQSDTNISILSKLENNERPVSLQMLERLAKPLGQSPEALILFCLKSKYQTLMKPKVLKELGKLEGLMRKSGQT